MCFKQSLELLVLLPLLFFIIKLHLSVNEFYVKGVYKKFKIVQVTVLQSKTTCFVNTLSDPQKIHTFLYQEKALIRILIRNMTHTVLCCTVIKIIYWSDRTASEYKNYKYIYNVLQQDTDSGVRVTFLAKTVKA